MYAFQWKCRPVIVDIPYHKVYVEVFGGTGIQLLVKPPCMLEVYNDRYGGITEYFNLRDVANHSGIDVPGFDNWRIRAEKWAHTQFMSIDNLYDRYKNVILEDLDWVKMFDDFDSPDTVFNCEFPEGFSDEQLVRQHANFLEGEVFYAALHESL